VDSEKQERAKRERGKREGSWRRGVIMRFRIHG